MLGLRYLALQFFGGGAEHFASLILCAVFLIMGFNFLMMGLLADLIGSNRRLVEYILLRMKRLNLESTQNTDRDDTTSKIDSSQEQQK